MQLLFESSTEHEGAAGLGILPGHGHAARVARGCRTSAGTSSRFERDSRADRGPRRRRGLLPRALLRLPAVATPPTSSATSEYGERFVLRRRARQRHGQPVPPREVLPRRAAHAAQLRPARGGRRSHDPLPRDRHHGRPGRAPGRGQASRTRRPTTTTRSRPPRRGSTAGARFLHVVDLDGARSGAPKSLEHLRRIVAETGIPIQYGGGLRTVEAVRDALRAGAERAIVGTAAFKRHRLPRRHRRHLRRRGSSSPSTSRTA